MPINSATAYIQEAHRKLNKREDNHGEPNISDCYEMVDKAKERGVQTEGIARLDSALRHQSDLIDRIESEGLEWSRTP